MPCQPITDPTINRTGISHTYDLVYLEVSSCDSLRRLAQKLNQRPSTNSLNLYITSTAMESPDNWTQVVIKLCVPELVEVTLS